MICQVMLFVISVIDKWKMDIWMCESLSVAASETRFIWFSEVLTEIENQAREVIRGDSINMFQNEPHQQQNSPF